MAPTVLVVGAGDGLGLELALQYLKKGYNVYGTFRVESAHESQEVGSSPSLSSICPISGQARDRYGN